MDNKIERETLFHNQRFTDPSNRAQKVKRFYQINRTIREQYEQFLMRHCIQARVLEYGCGTGSYAFDLARNGDTVLGIDISEVALEIAETRAEQEGVGDKVTFRLMNAECLDIDDNSFDLVCGTGILHHLQLEKALSEISRILRPQGHAAFIEPLGHNVFINRFRNRTPEIRSIDEHPLLTSDVAMFSNYFSEVQTDYFYLITLAAALFVSFPGFNALLNLLESMDRLLFKLPYFQRQAWQIFIRLSAPIK